LRNLLRRFVRHVREIVDIGVIQVWQACAEGGEPVSQGPEGKAKDLWARLGKTLRSGAETIVQETKELTKLGKLKVDLMSLENERDRKFEDIGRSAHVLYKGGGVFPPELADLFLAVDDVDSRIDAKRQEAEKLRAEGAEAKEKAAAEKAAVGKAADEEQRFCTQCGAKLQPGDVFCPKCGLKVS